MVVVVVAVLTRPSVHRVHHADVDINASNPRRVGASHPHCTLPACVRHIVNSEKKSDFNNLIWL